MLESSNQPTGSQRSRPRSALPPHPSDPRKQRARRQTAAHRPGWQRLLLSWMEPSKPRRVARSLSEATGRTPIAELPATPRPARGTNLTSLRPPTSGRGNRPESPVQFASGSRANVRPFPARPAAAAASPRPERRTAGNRQAQRPERRTLPVNRGQKQPEARPQRPASPLVHFVRLLILGVGVGAIAGTALSVWKPGLRHPSVAQSTSPSAVQALKQPASAATLSSFNSILGRGQEMSALATRITPMLQGVTDLTPGLFLVDLDTGNYYNLNGTTAFSAASMIKVPIVIAFFQDVDAGKIRLDEQMTMQQADLASGSGDMQYDGVGTRYTALDVVTKMITVSDNTATNMLIHRMGGIEALNQRFQQWGLQQTRIRNLLPDLEGTNTTTPRELAMLMTMMSQGELVSLKSHDRLLDIMRHTVNDSLLPTALGAGATIAHKTGDIGSLVGDTGLVDMPNGKRFAITVMVKRPNNDGRAQDLIRQMSTAVGEYLTNPTGASSSPSTPAPTDTPTSPSDGSSPSAGADSSPGNSSPGDASPSPLDSPHESSPDASGADSGTGQGSTSPGTGQGSTENNSSGDRIPDTGADGSGGAGSATHDGTTDAYSPHSTR